jgi:hypothetical protein
MYVLGLVILRDRIQGVGEKQASIGLKHHCDIVETRQRQLAVQKPRRRSRHTRSSRLRKPLKANEIMKRANFPNEEACQFL